jgi:cellulose synthase/poly-beta-1,6-N-acetylglucosamine synthase-like glycosyltransferase
MYGLAPDNDNDSGVRFRPRSERGHASELDCLRGVLAPGLLAAAERRSRQLNIGADQVLIRCGVIDEADYLARLSLHLGIPHEPRLDVSRADIQLSDTQMTYAAHHGVLRFRSHGQLLLAFAPRNFTARRLCDHIAGGGAFADHIRLIPNGQFNDLLIAGAAMPLARAAADGLGRRMPAMSAGPFAKPHPRWRRRLAHGCGTGVLAAALCLPPAFAIDAWAGLLAAWFLGFAALRLGGALVPAPSLPRASRIGDHDLPAYTVIAALYREASSIAPLVAAIEALDYPREKLQVILAVEPNDLETRAAIARLGTMPHVEVLVAPTFGPQTKPKALNWALPFVRGSYVAVYDAEDRPDAAQLRDALAAFRRFGPATACVQASLMIDNASDSWLSGTFAAEYAGQFDVFLPGLARLGIPLPLGGSSNHFHTESLRKVGGWDAYNVTEDADLGFRLARFGYRIMTFPSSTCEEAPVRFGAWLRQRSRWMKGWMQTWSVHMRSPLRLLRESGLRGALSLNLLVGGNVLTALACPFLFAQFAAYLASSAVATPTGFLASPLAPLHVAAIASGYVSTAVIGLMGLKRQGRLRHGWILLLTPLYWLCLSLAAWRALFQLLREPYRWEKTEHGLGTRPGQSEPVGRRKRRSIIRSDPTVQTDRNLS